MKISLVIPSLRSPSLGATLQAIARQTAIERIEAVIVAGQQALPEVQGLPQLRYIEVADRPTPARNRNAGVAEARGEYICFTDADCLPQADWVERLLRKAEDGAFAVAGAVDIPREMPYWGRCDHLLGFENQASGIAHKPNIEYAATLNFCVQRALFTSLGGFDEHFERAGGEDRDLCWRLTHAGHRIEFEPSAVVVHNHLRTGLASAWEHIYQYGRVTAQFRLRHLNQASPAWKLGASSARLPVAGEIASFGRVGLRAITRLVRQPALLRYIPYLPGVIVLDLAHSLGMVHALRSHAA